MKVYSAFLDVISAELSLKDLTEQFGMEPSQNSHDLGSPRGRKGSWKVTIWRLESEASESASLDAHCKNLLAKAQRGKVLESILHLQVDASINIAAFFDTATCSVTIPPVCLEVLRDYPLGLEVTCYPSKMEPDDQST
jgi:hypothetical protein